MLLIVQYLQLINVHHFVLIIHKHGEKADIDSAYGHSDRTVTVEPKTIPLRLWKAQAWTAC